MPLHLPRTPEILLGRNDSRNPATTCKGITSTGRPCRRSVASARRLQTLPLGLETNSGSYCWQHTSQAEHSAPNGKNAQNSGGKHSARSDRPLPVVREKSSIDTLVQRLGVNTVSQAGHRSQQQWQRIGKAEPDVDSPQRAYSSDAPYAEKTHPQTRADATRKPRKKLGFWASLCCMASTGDADDYIEVARHKRRTDQAFPAPSRPEISAEIPATRTTYPRDTLPVLSNTRAQTTAASPGQASNLLDLIPPDLPPHTTSVLLAELAKPISPYDEDGYIYIFWLTPASAAPPAETTARSLLTTPESRPRQGRKLSDVMSDYSVNDSQIPGSGTGKTIMLKIGRANNITRRMNEWQRQCGYALTLVRWYPYIPSAPSTPTPLRKEMQALYPDLSGRETKGGGEGTSMYKCPHIHRVERLIHLELAGSQVKRECTACGREHREWFEVSASREGVAAVDGVVRRWIAWAQDYDARAG